MKTKFLTLFILCITLIVGCTKEESLLEMQDGMMLKKASKTNIIKVEPCSSGDVMTKAQMDWQNINDALNDAKHGEVVQLAAGTYYLHKSIVCWGFDGKLCGAGMGKTIIRTVPGEVFDIKDCPPINWSFEPNSGAFMFCFAHNYFENERNISVSDLSIVIDSPTPIRPKGNEEINSMHAIMTMYASLDNERDKPVELNVSYSNISVEGEKDDEKYKYKGYSVFAGLSGYGYSNGIFEVKNAHIENTSGCIKPHAFFGPDANIIIKNCHLKNSTHGVFAFFDHSWTILGNQIENCEMGLALLKRGAFGDIWEGPIGKSSIKNNNIKSYSKMGIGSQFSSNVQIKDNVIKGSGMFTGIAGIGGNNWIIKDNNLCGVVPVPPFNSTIFLKGTTNTEIKDNANQMVGGPDASDPTVTIGDDQECND